MAEEQRPRGPGRPRKTKPIEVCAGNVGCCDTPKDPENVLEMVYDNPLLFKKLMALYKKYDLNELTFCFEQDRVELRLRNEKGKCTLHTTLYGRMMSRYYCAEPMVRTVKRDNLDKIFKSKDKNYPQVTFILRRDDSRSKLYIMLYSEEVESQLQYTEDLIPETGAVLGPAEIPDDYHLQFELPSGHFKKLIGDISASNAKAFNIKKDGSGPVDVGYQDVGRSDLAATYPNKAKINLVTQMLPDDIFNITIPIAYVKPFSDAHIGKTVKIIASKFRPFVVVSDIDALRYARADGTIVEGPACRLQLSAEINHS
jgi:hypothetical protein